MHTGSYQSIKQVALPKKAMSKFIEIFSSLPDPRIERCKRHGLSDIIYITIVAILCGADDWEDIEAFGLAREEWFSSFLKLPNGIPSHDTFNRVFARLDPQALQQRFTGWVQSIATVQDAEIIAIDGKRLCNSGEGGIKSIVHMVSAFANGSSLVLGQLKVEDKGNEITAIPELLKTLYIKGSVVTIDAMGCQKDIAAAIIEKEADDVLAVKGNQEFLYDDIREAFRHAVIEQQHTTQCISHGRIEKRTCRVITGIDWICSAQEWKALTSVVMIESERIVKQTGQKECQTRYYISSLKESAERMNSIIRSHWGIENKLHWTLDVVFSEDRSRKRAGNAAENFSTVTKIAFNVLKKKEDKKGAKNISVKTKRFKCNISQQYLTEVLKNL